MPEDWNSLQTPKDLGKTIEEFRNECVAIRDTDPARWRKYVLEKSSKGKELVSWMRRIAYINIGKDIAGWAVAALGIPFEHSKYAVINRLDKDWIKKQLEQIHPLNNGQRTYLKPEQVKRSHTLVWDACNTVYKGGYPKALDDLLGKGSYEASCGHLRPFKEYTRAELTDKAKTALEAIVKDCGDVTRVHVRAEHPREWRFVKHYMKKTRTKNYNYILKKFDLNDYRRKDVDKKNIGKIGELFTLLERHALKASQYYFILWIQ